MGKIELEGTAEWSASSLENCGAVTGRGSIPLPSSTALSSIGQDSWFSAREAGFDSPKSHQAGCWSNGMMSVSKTEGGRSIRSRPAIRLHRLMVRTPVSQAGNPGSTPGVTTKNGRLAERYCNGLLSRGLRASRFDSSAFRQLLPPVGENEEQQDEDRRKASTHPERGRCLIFEAVEPARREAEDAGRKEAGKLSEKIAPEEGYGFEDAGELEFHSFRTASESLNSQARLYPRG